MNPRLIDTVARELGGRAASRRGALAGVVVALLGVAGIRQEAAARKGQRCGRPRVKCGPTCCSKGSACAGKTCCKVSQGASVCHDPATERTVCCPPDQTCTDDGCCPTGTGTVACGGRCCPTGSECVGGACCAVGDGAVACDGACCPAGSECAGSTCCPVDSGAVVCRGTCCPSGSACSDQGCCPTDEGSVVCGGTCCPKGSACAGGTCCPVSSGSAVCGQACCQPDPWQCRNGTCVNRCNAAPAPGNDYSGCTLSQDFSFADLTRANFDRAQIKSRFAGATLVGAKFREITGAGIDFPKAVLDEADFGLAKVGWLNLDGASARRVNFAGIDISGSRLVDTDLTGSWFMDANLDESYMHDADLSRANFSGAKLRAVDCSVQPKMVGTILIGATLFRSQFDVATILEAVLCNTTMPDGTVNNRDC